FERLVESGLHRLAVADVDGSRRGAGHDVLQARLVAGEQRQARTFVGEPPRDRAADAGPRSRDDYVLAFEAIHAGESTGAARSCDRSASALVTKVSTANVASASTTVSTARVSYRPSAAPASTSPIGDPMH